MDTDLASSSGGGTLRSTGKPIILAVDDDNDNLVLLQYVLELFDCATICEADSRVALSYAKSHQPDLILLDIVLPNMNGIEFVQHIRRDAHTANIPVIAVTALARAEDREQLLAAGFNGYISKPYMLDELEAVIRHYSHLPLRVHPPAECRLDQGHPDITEVARLRLP